jgi:chaperonin cofactor prefoldin
MPAIDERARHELFVAVQDTLGPSHADTLMSLLPPVGWADVATKQDLHELEARMAMRFDIVNERFAVVDERFKSLEERLDERFKGVDERFKGIDERFKGIDERFASIEQRLADMASGTDRRFTEVARRFTEIDGRLEAFERQFEIVHNRLDGIQKSIIDQGRALMFGLIGSSASMASLCLGAIALLR